MHFVSSQTRSRISQAAAGSIGTGGTWDAAARSSGGIGCSMSCRLHLQHKQQTNFLIRLGGSFTWGRRAAVPFRPLLLVSGSSSSQAALFMCCCPYCNEQCSATKLDWSREKDERKGDSDYEETVSVDWFKSAAMEIIQLPLLLSLTLAKWHQYVVPNYTGTTLTQVTQSPALVNNMTKETGPMTGVNYMTLHMMQKASCYKSQMLCSRIQLSLQKSWLIQLSPTSHITHILHLLLIYSK